MSVGATENQRFREPLKVPRPDRITGKNSKRKVPLRVVAEDESGLDPEWSAAASAAVAGLPVARVRS